MFDVPLEFVLISPEIDIFIGILVLYISISKYMKEMMFKDVGQLLWIDIKISVIVVALGYLNYAGMSLEVFGLSISWFAYIIITQFFVEFVMLFPMRQKMK